MVIEMSAMASPEYMHGRLKEGLSSYGIQVSQPSGSMYRVHGPCRVHAEYSVALAEMCVWGARCGRDPFYYGADCSYIARARRVPLPR